MKKVLLIAILFISISSNLFATHFRYGHISWTRQPGTRVVTFTVTCAWNPNGVSESTNLNFGDNITNGYVVGNIIGSGPGYVVTQYSVTHTYTTDGPFTAYLIDCCRISTLQGGAADVPFQVSSTVCLIGNNGGSPINLSPQILKLPILANAQLQLNAIDSDGSSVSFSQATIAGAGYTYSPPTVGGNTLSVSSTGVVSWNTSGATVGQLYVLRVKFSDGCAESEADYIVEIVGGTCTACTDKVLADFTDNDRFCATQYLCNNLIVKSNQPDPKGNLIRGDLANVAYRGLIGESYNTIAKDFPCPFTDLQINDPSTSEYYKHAKTLSYLDYADGRPPFDRRDSTNFNPTYTISRSLVLKVLLEAWNIDEFAIDNAAPMPFADAGLGTHPQYRYIKKAYELGIINGTVGSLFLPDANCTREDAFLILYKILTTASIIKPTLTQINAGFFIPGQYRPDNLGVGVGTDRGNFNHYTKTSFAMDGVVPLIFAHSYNSFTTELPNEMYPNMMGRGWTHSFNCYVTATGTGTNARLVIHYPDGKLHYYKKVGATFIAESIGVFDAIVATSTTLTITTPSKVEYYFEKMTGQSGNFWLIKTIKDRNLNTLAFTNQLGINNIPRLASVADQAGRSLTFTYLTGELRNYLSQVTLAGVGASFNGRNVQFTYHPLVLDGDGIKDLATYKEYDLLGALKPTLYSYLTVEGSEHLLSSRI